MSDTERKCLIFGAGDFSPEDYHRLNLTINKRDVVIACDAGFRYTELLKIEPTFVIGDFDSAKRDEELYAKIRAYEEAHPKNVIRLKEEKDDTDLMFAAKYALLHGISAFYIFGGMGGRRFSLSMATVQTMLYLKHQAAECVTTTDAGNTTLLVMEGGESMTLPEKAKGFISLFVLSKRVTGLTLKNLKFEMEDGILKNDEPMGVSNEFLPGKRGEISLRTGSLLVVLELTALTW